MCEKKQFKYCPSTIDECMKRMIEQLKFMLKDNWEILACCCGHGKYSMTIVCQDKKFKAPFDLISDINIHRKRKFYNKDKDGYYYIKEVENATKK